MLFREEYWLWCLFTHVLPPNVHNFCSVMPYACINSVRHWLNKLLSICLSIKHYHEKHHRSVNNGSTNLLLLSAKRSWQLMTKIIRQQQLRRQTNPVFPFGLAESVSVVIKVAIEINAAINTALNNLEWTHVTHRGSGTVRTVSFVWVISQSV